MIRTLAYAFSIVLLALILDGAAVAQDNFPARLALVIGNGDYPGLDRLANPSNDHDDVSAALRDLGFTVYGGKNLGQRDTGLHVDEFIDSLKRAPGALALFYFSGHGSQRSGASGNDNLLWPAGEKPGSGESLALRLNTVISRMHDAGASGKVVILDACRTNSADTTRGARGLATYDGVASGLIIAYASAAGRVAEDNPRERNGLYTAQLLKQLHTPGLSLNSILLRTAEGVQTAIGSTQLPELRVLGADRRLSEVPILIARKTDEKKGAGSGGHGPPTMRPGTYFKYTGYSGDLKRAATFENVIETVEENLITVKVSRDGVGEANIWYDRNLRQVTANGDPRTGTRNPSAVRFDFPLYVGKAWSDSYEGTHLPTGKRYNYRNNYQVMAYEEVATKGGTFFAYRIRRENRNLTANTVEYEVYWYAPSIGFEIKSKPDWQSGKELLEFRQAP